MGNFRTLALATALATLAVGTVQATPVQWEASSGGNDHWYELVLSGHTSWTSANFAATSSTYLGQSGYLASITSALEQVFLNTLNTNNTNAWLGGTDAAVEGTWEWTSGEAFSYSNWNSFEPNNFFGEDFLVGWWSGDNWNDLSNNSFFFSPHAYVVEYGPVLAAVPLPAGLPLILGALGILGLVGRRRKAS